MENHYDWTLDARRGSASVDDRGNLCKSAMTVRPLLKACPVRPCADFTHKLTFVPAGHDFRGWQRPRVLTRVVAVGAPITERPPQLGRIKARTGLR
jgi:hypothetical protein